MRDIQKILGKYEAVRGRYAAAAKVRFDRSRFGLDWDYIEAEKISTRILERLVYRSRSPLEECLGVAILCEAAGRGWVVWDRRLPKTDPQTATWLEAVPGKIPILLLEGSRRIVIDPGTAFVADFFVALSGKLSGQPTVVECDSLTWHQGAAKSRDRLKNEYVASKGWAMLRFMAERILSDPDSCAREVLDRVCGGAL